MTRTQLREAKSQAGGFRPTALAASSATRSAAQPADILPTGRALVAEVQASLSRLGYDPGSADGLMGRRTATAVADFQRKAGLPADGKAS